MIELFCVTMKIWLPSDFRSVAAGFLHKLIPVINSTWSTCKTVKLLMCLCLVISFLICSGSTVVVDKVGLETSTWDLETKGKNLMPGLETKTKRFICYGTLCLHCSILSPYHCVRNSCPIVSARINTNMYAN